MSVFTEYNPEKPQGVDPVEPTTYPQAPARQPWEVPSEAQFKFLKSLVDERDLGLYEGEVEDARRAWREGTITKRQVSGLIDRLKRQPYKPKTATPQVTEEGVYFKDDLYYKVVENQEGTALYAKRWEAEDEGGGTWVYVGRPSVVGLTPDHKATADQAAKFGHLTSRCVFCSRKLADDRSIDVGYGPICAAKYDLPWGA